MQVMDIFCGRRVAVLRFGLTAFCAIWFAWSGLAAAADMPPALSEEDATVYRAAFLALETGTDPLAAAESARLNASDQTLVTVLTWRALIASGTFPEIAAFLADHPDWPQRTDLRLNAERTIPEDAPLETLAAYFAGNPPLTVLAAARYDETLRGLDRTDAAEAYMRRAWQRLPLTEQQLAVFVAYLSFLQTEDHADRMSALLDAGREDEARAMLAYLPEGYEALLEARLALVARADDVEVKVAAVPEDLTGDLGLTFDRVRWRRQAGHITGAVELLNQLPAEAGGSRWWSERRDLVRLELALGRIDSAYALAAAHRQDDGLARYQAELLAGWIALSLLDDADLALPHFETLWESTMTPIGRATAAYWLGRTHRASGDEDAAARWFGEAATRPSTYYGVLASEEGAELAPLADPEVTDADIAAFVENDIARMVRQLHQIEIFDLRDRLFGVLLSETGTGAGFVLAARMADELGMPGGVLDAAEAASALGYELGVAGWPTVPLPDGVPDQALTLSVMRQESHFDPAAVSRAGALGMMQLLPTTAAETAAALGLDFEEARLLEDPDYNIRLGSEHMATLMADYGGSVILAAAAYNAGPARVADWLSEFGDPRNGADPATWVERIPIHETRNYVQRILEGYRVYQAALPVSSTVGDGDGAQDPN